jgi:hypothetical protein
MSETFTPGHALSKFDTGDNPGAVKLNSNWTKIDKHLILPSTSFPATYPEEGFVLRTDEKTLYQNTGTEIVPVWTVVIDTGTSIVAGAGLTLTGEILDVGAGDGIQVDADSVTVKLDGDTLSKSASGLKAIPDAGSLHYKNATFF